jgi:hypothetical protein
MYTMAMRLVPDSANAEADAEVINSLIQASVYPEDHVEHVYVSATNSQCDIIVFFTNSDLAAVQVIGTALSSRLIGKSPPGWTLVTVAFSSVA